MSTPPTRLARVVTRIAAAVAAAVALSLPLGYGILAYTDLSDSLSFKARVKASAMNSLIADHPDLWTYAQNRLQGLLQHEPVPLGNELVRVLDSHGMLVTQTGTPPAAPALVRRQALYDSGRVVGQLEISTSLRELAPFLALATLLGLLLGALVFLVMRALPLRALKRALSQLYDEKERAETTLNTISDAVISTDARGRILYLNPAAEQLLQTTRSLALGRRATELVQLVDEKTHLLIDHPLHQALAEKRNVIGSGQSELRMPVGTGIAVDESAAPIVDAAGAVSGGVLVLRDVSLSRAYVQRRSWEATHDALTGLFNRREFENRVKLALAGAQTAREQHAICFLDLDGFKVVNDSAGHAAGDHLLVQIAQLLRARIRDTDTLARLGGDEFGVLLTGCDIARAKLIAAEMLSAVRELRLNWESRIFSVGISIGLTSIAEHHLTVAEVLGEADSACYWSKEQGRNRISVYLPGDTHLVARRSQTKWVTRIRMALDHNQFVLYQQSFRHLNPSGDAQEHLEVLLRMLDDDGTLIAPDSFLPAAERYNLMPEIDRWVVGRVFANYARLCAERGQRPLTCAINLSGASLNTEGFLEFVKDQMLAYQLQPGAICFELTESVAVNNMPAASRFIRECKSIGIDFAIDDFGMGNSSLIYLKNLPVDYLKIDGGFIRNIEHDMVDRAMTETINHISHLLGKKTIAEHAEDETTIDILRTIGIDFAQGYAVARPVPLLKPPA